MKKCAYILVVLLFASLSVYGGQERVINIKCKPFGVRNFLAVAVLESKNGNIYNSVSELERSIQNVQGAWSDIDSDKVYQLNIEAVIKSGYDSFNKIKQEQSVSFLDESCSVKDSTTLENVIKYGVPLIFPSSQIKIGSRWKKAIRLLTNNGEVPLTISYTFDRLEKLLGKDVAVFSLTMIGSESDGVSRKMWAGIGREVWDIDDGTPLIRIYELKRGNSFVKEFDFRLSYSEAAIF